MGLITGLLAFPVKRVRGVVWAAEQVRQEAERQWSDPAAIQAELAEVEALRERGELDEAEAADWEEELVARLLARSPQHQAEPWEGADDG